MGIKRTIKDLLRFMGILHPARGVKIPPKRKIEILLEYKTPAMRTFVETGTEFGATIEGVRGSFDAIHSIEFDEVLFRRATEKFAADQNIHLYRGDSAEVISQVLRQVNAPALFWLDAHGTGEITLDNSPVRA